MCGWSNRVTTGQQWIRKAAYNHTFPFGPISDGKGNMDRALLIDKSKI